MRDTWNFAVHFLQNLMKDKSAPNSNASHCLSTDVHRWGEKAKTVVHVDLHPTWKGDSVVNQVDLAILKVKGQLR